MALRNYVIHNKKKVSAIVAALLVVIVAIMVIVRFNVGTKADVFQENSEGKKQLKSEVNILEIVAEYGQQIIGYTVSGYEPITKEQIENYHGDIDIADFRNATGYELQKSGSGEGNCYYTVRESALNQSFNKNVLGESMGEGDIIVTVCQANEVTKEMIDNADLIYLNSNNYNENLFYYYDQIVNNGEKGVKPGERGAGYDDSVSTLILKKDAAIKKIQRAAGRKAVAESLTEKDFVLAGIQSFQSHNMKAYMDGITNREKGSLTTANDEEFLTLMERLISAVDEAEKNQLSVINGFVGRKDMTQEDKENLQKALMKAPLSNYYMVNYDAYVESISNATRAYSNLNNVNSMLNTTNGAEQAAAWNNLKSYKASGNTEIDLEAIGKDIHKLEFNYNDLNTDLIRDYAIAFTEESFHFANASNKTSCISDIQSLISNVNEKKKQEALNLIADAPVNSESMALLQGNPLFYFGLAEIEGYDEYNVDAYLAALAGLEDKSSLKGNGEPPVEEESSEDEESTAEDVTEPETSEPEEETTDIESEETSETESSDQEETTVSDEETDTTEETTISDEETDTTEETTTSDEEEKVVYNYDYEKIKAFIETVNADNMYVNEDIPYDLSWENALELYNYAIIDEKGFMYDTELLTDGTIGDFTQDLYTNDNNLYKILLLMRQLQPDYCMNSLLKLEKDSENGLYVADDSKIDEDGVYTADDGSSISAWYKYTFYQEGSQDYSRYREPNVVGQTYSQAGVKGNAKNYVYKHIYSYTGEQFVGGALFIGESFDEFLTGGGVFTPGTGDSASTPAGILSDKTDETDNFIFLDTKTISGTYWGEAYAYFWSDATGKNDTIRMSKLDSPRVTYRVQVPEWAEKVLFKPNKDSWSGQTVDVLLSQGNAFYLKSSFYGGKREVTTAVPSGATMRYGNLTNSKNNGTVYYAGSLELELKSYNIGTAYYTIDNGPVQTIRPGEKITIGADLPGGTNTKIDFWYDTYDGRQGTRVYNYQKVSYDYMATNVINNAQVKYFNSAEIEFTFSGISNVKYQINSGSQQNLNSGDRISIGSGIAEGEQTTVTVTYMLGDTTITRKYYLLKASRDDIELENNYLSTNTADNVSSLPADALLDTSTNEILTNGSKGDVIRYIMGITLNHLTTYPFNLLEIQPTAVVTVWDSYEGVLKLADYLNVEVPAEMTATNYSEYFNVTHMSVKEFNTRNEDLTGKYDLIYFGIDSGYQVVNEYTVEGNKLYRTFYNDTSMNGLVYTGIGDEYGIWAFLKGTASEDYTLVGGSPSGTQKIEYDYWKEYLTDHLKDNQDASWNLDFNAAGTWVLKNTTSTVRLLGNDITVKKMNELLNYVKAGYPILLPEEIYNCDSDLYIDYDGKSGNAAQWRYVDVNSKMYHFITTIKTLGYNKNTNEFDGLDENGNPIFTDGKTYANIVREIYAKDGRNPDNLSADQKFNGGLSFATKRNVQVDFTIKESPQEYNKDTNGNPITPGNRGTYIKANTQNYKFTLQIDSDISVEWLNNNYNYQIYLDKSGTGRFDDSTTIELDPICSYNEDGTVTLEGRWPGDVEGFMPWKVVAYNKFNPENHFSYNGFSAFEIPSTKKQPVYVLWVRTRDQGRTLDFQNMLTKYKDEISESGYDIRLLNIDYGVFQNVWLNTPPTEYNSENTMLRYYTLIGRGAKFPNWSVPTAEEIQENPEIDMIVFGFCDSYAGLDLKSIAGHNNIEYFVNSGHSLMFAHDNASYLPTLNYYINVSGTVVPGMTTDFARYNTTFFRKMLGMDVYGATYSAKCFDESSDEYLEYLANTRKYLRDDVKQADFRGIIETCVFHYTANNQGNKLYSLDMHSKTPHAITDWQRTKTVQRINQGQISEYPYIIGEILPTASTHTQYMNLNMEDDDITVWYTLSCDKNGTYNQENSKYYLYTEGDGSNNYYIYSKGNVTYTGAGHSGGQTDTEQKLFVNTVIAAIKAGNFAPQIVFTEADKSADGKKNILYHYNEGITVKWKPIDYDEVRGEKVFTDCKIYIDINEDGLYDSGDILLYDGNPDPNTDRSHTRIIDPATGNFVSILADELENREEYSFMLPEDTIQDIVTTSGGRLNNINAKPITVQITDDGTDKDPSKKRTVSNCVWIIEASLHNLN